MKKATTLGVTTLDGLARRAVLITSQQNQSFERPHTADGPKDAHTKRVTSSMTPSEPLFDQQQHQPALISSPRVPASALLSRSTPPPSPRTPTLFNSPTPKDSPRPPSSHSLLVRTSTPLPPSFRFTDVPPRRHYGGGPVHTEETLILSELLNLIPDDFKNKICYSNLIASTFSKAQTTRLHQSVPMLHAAFKSDAFSPEEKIRFLKSLMGENPDIPKKQLTAEEINVFFNKTLSTIEVWFLNNGEQNPAFVPSRSPISPPTLCKPVPTVVLGSSPTSVQLAFK